MLQYKLNRISSIYLLGFLVSALSVAPAPLRAQPPTPIQPARDVQAMLDSRAQSMRLLMRINNFEDAQMQDTLIQFLKEQATARQNVRDQRSKMRAGLRDNALSDDQVLAVIKEYRVNVEQAKEDYKKALVALDEKIGYSKKPRLEGTLVSLGIIGDEDWFANGPASFGIYADIPKPKVAVPAPNPQ